MINYFGIGMDGEISLAFEKKRTSNRFCNKVVYGWEGAKKILCCCCTSSPLDKQIAYLRTTKEEKNTTSRMNETMDSLNQQLIDKNADTGNVLFSTSKTIPAQSLLDGSPICIMATNIPSVMGGRHNLWEKSGNALGLKDPYGKSYTSKNKPTFKKQTFNDGVLEFNSFNYVVDMGLGRAKKIAQDKGPMEIKYKKDKKEIKTFMQIDGESYMLKNPDSINIKLADVFPNGKLKVLRRGKRDD